MPGEIETASKIITRAEKKVARAALASLYRVLRKSIGLLAGEAGVSEPSNFAGSSDRRYDKRA